MKAKEAPVAAKKEEAVPVAVAPRHEPAGLMWADPFAYMRRLNDEFDRVFHGFGFLRGFPGTGLMETPREIAEVAKAAWSPQTELLEREGKLVVRIDLPGLTKKDVSVDVTDDMLTIKGERKQEKEEKTETTYRSERCYGSFYRSFRLPTGTDVTAAKALFKDGVLEIEMPAPPKPEERIKRLEIEEGKP